MHSDSARVVLEAPNRFRKVRPWVVAYIVACVRAQDHGLPRPEYVPPPPLDGRVIEAASRFSPAPADA